MKKYFYFLLSTFCLCKMDVNALNKKGITIVGWTGIHYNYTTLERFQEFKDAGFNCNLTYYPNVDSLVNAIKLAEEVGIELIALCPDILGYKYSTVVNKVKDSPAVVAYFLKDEPVATDFDALLDQKNNIESIDSSRFCYINLNPNYASLSVLKTNSYEQYVDLYIQKFKPKILSFDFYPIAPNNQGDLVLSSRWFDNLELISRKARENNIPFWGFVLATAHAIYPVPKLPQMRLEAFGNLIYGAQGIQYFNYWTQFGEDTNPNTMFRHGPIDNKTGERTEVYYHAKEINKQIQALNSVFYNCTVDSVRHSGNTIPMGVVELKGLPPIFESFDSHGSNIALSYIRNNNKKYLVILNKDFNNSIKLSLKAKSKKTKKISNTGILHKVPRRVYDETIKPGDVLIFSY